MAGSSKTKLGSSFDNFGCNQMPFVKTWVEPELICEHEGVKVFRSYDDMWQDEPMTFWYVIYHDNTPTEESEVEDTAYHFDVRKLTKAKDGGNHKKVILAALEAGTLKFPDEIRKCFEQS
jgi:hypothetical protein